MTSTALRACVGLWASLQLASFEARAAEVSSPRQTAPLVRWTPLKGKIRIEGTSSIDDWQVESRSLEGFIEVAAAFPASGAGESHGESVDARVESWVQTRSLRSVEKDGKPFSNKMDSIMHDALNAAAQPRITYRLGKLTPRAGQSLTDAPAEFEARGRLAVAGVTNEISMPVYALRLGNNQMRLWGGTTLKMTDFKIQPPSPKIALGLIRTADEIKFSFEWVLKR